jgi:hypothetical protein
VIVVVAVVAQQWQVHVREHAVCQLPQHRSVVVIAINPYRSISGGKISNSSTNGITMAIRTVNRTHSIVLTVSRVITRHP